MWLVVSGEQEKEYHLFEHKPTYNAQYGWWEYKYGGWEDSIYIDVSGNSRIVVETYGIQITEIVARKLVGEFKTLSVGEMIRVE